MEENETENTDRKLDENVIKKKTNDEKVKYENIITEQELLGSVTTVNNPGLRTSARVIQKMKQDSIRPTTPPPSEKKEGPAEKGLQRTPSQTKPPKVIWSNFEKNLFFDALNEFGKDFESIANFINSKIKRKSVADQSFKTKEQIRQIYYQTFHKLSKYLKFSDDVKKPAQELYALINYGEMRRKLAFVSDKNCMKIKDLVYKGHVTVRSKGKNIRIKTPPCKALRKLNQLDDWQEDINLPAKIEVCLKPRNMDAWARVQNIAQNPLVQTTVPLQKKLVNLIKTFQLKWRNEETKLALQAFNMGKGTQNTKQENKINEIDNLSFQEPLLCLCPPSDAVIHRPLISITEFLSSFSICLNSYEQKIGVRIRGETLCNKRQRTDSGCEKKSPESKKIKSEPEVKTVEGNGDVNVIITDGDDRDEGKEPKIDFTDVSNSNQSNPDELKDILLNEDALNRLDRQDTNEPEITKKSELLINCSDNAVSGFTSLSVKAEEPVTEVNSKCTPDSKPKKKEVRCTGARKKENRNINNLKPLLDEDTEKKIRNGWTIQNSSDISVGDLYITFGHDSKITFEYYWIKKEVEKITKKERSSMPYNVNNVDEESLKAIKSSNISNKLRHLLLIASLTERVKRKPCSCGHMCEKGVKNKKGENETASKTYVSNKTYTAANNDSVFRQPAAPFRRQGLENFRVIPNGLRYNHARLLMKSRSLASKQIVVQRLLPVQPGMNQSYDVVTPQVHVRTIIDKPNAQLSLWSNDKQGKAAAQNIIKDVNSSKNEQSDTGHEDPKLPTANSCNVDKMHDTTVGVHINSNNRPFMALGKNDELDVASDSSSCVELVDGVKDVEVISLNSKDELFSTSSSGSSDAEENGYVKIMNINEDPGIQQLMEISLPSPARPQCLDDSDICSIPPMSPMRLIRDSPSDPKWLEENLNDFSLSSFLGHLDEMNRDLDSLSVISESSQDYMTKFAEIAASMQNEDKDL